jgi:hypothetical protein
VKSGYLEPDQERSGIKYSIVVSGVFLFAGNKDSIKKFFNYIWLFFQIAGLIKSGTFFYQKRWFIFNRFLSRYRLIKQVLISMA